jgi:hypothetical protein
LPPKDAIGGKRPGAKGNHRARGDTTGTHPHNPPEVPVLDPGLMAQLFPYDPLTLHSSAIRTRHITGSGRKTR